MGYGVNMEVMLQGTETQCGLPGEARPTGTRLVASVCWHGNISLHTVCVSSHSPFLCPCHNLIVPLDVEFSRTLATQRCHCFPTLCLVFRFKFHPW